MTPRVDGRPPDAAWSGRRRGLAGLVLLILLFAGLGRAVAASTSLRVIVSAQQTPQERAIAEMFVEEMAKRTSNGPVLQVGDGNLPPDSRSQDPSSVTLVVLARRSQIPALLPANLSAAWNKALTVLQASDHREAFSIVSLSWRRTSLVIVAGSDTRGELFGAGWLLRHTNFAGASPQLPQHLRIFEFPEKPVRGHQIGYRFKNNTYDAWTLAEFEQGIRDLAIFGTNTIQLIAPVSDDAPSSPLFPAPALETLIGISKILAKYGLDCDLYYPEMRKDYRDTAAVEAELRDFEALVRAMPRLDALYVPGGDPGHTAPEVLFPLVEREAAVLHRYHPEATVWVSAQGFDRVQFQRFYALLDAHPVWLTGVFFGPESRDSFFTQRERIPARYAMQFYPDIAHTMHAEFPVPQWDPIFALTEGREPICPRPEAFAAIYHRFQQLHSGFITYSEGVNDDVNKTVWSQLGWSSKTPINTILEQYARLFLHREGAQQELAVQAIRGLEQDWRGPIPANRRIPLTLRELQQLEQDSTEAQVRANGRWESLLYRAVYDDYLQRKLKRERTAETAALSALDRRSGSSAGRVASAREILHSSVPDRAEQIEHDRLFTLAGQLFHDFGLQLSVPLYGASNWERGANLDRVDTPLTETAWLNSAMDAALKQPEELARQQDLYAVTHWAHPTKGALYDDLGDPTNEPHLVRGLGWARDPEMYGTAIDGIAARTLADGWRLSWLDYAETLYENPLRMQYRGLDQRRKYRLRITYAGEDFALPLRLIAGNNLEIQPATRRHSNPETVEFTLPGSAIVNGTLDLRWMGPAGSGGSGRGRQVGEVWLLPQ